METPAPDVVPGGPRRRAAIRGAAVLLAVLGLVAVAVLGLVLVQRGEALPGTRVAGVDVGGLGEADVRARLEGLAAQRADLEVGLTGGGVTTGITGEQVGLSSDLDASTAAALDAGRDGGLLQRLGDELRARTGAERELPLVTSVDAAELDAAVEQVRAAVDREPVPGGFTVTGDTAEAVAPQDGQQLDVTATRTQVQASLLAADPGPVALPVTVTPVAITQAQVEAVTTQAQQALDQPLVLVTGDATLTLSPAQFGSALRAVADPATGLALSADGEALTETVTEQAESLRVEPRSASLDSPAPSTLLTAKGDATFMPASITTSAVAGREGREVDVAAAVAVAVAALEGGRATGELPLTVLSAPVSVEGLAAVDQVIGSFTTDYACCAPRASNIARMAEIVDGTVVAPGATFSLNDTAGQRTTARGFLADGAILDGELVQQVGGGVSQFSTTLYNAVWFAGLPSLEHKPHSAYISRYPPGREATLDFFSIDNVFRNTTDAPVVVRATTTSTSVTVALYGHTGDRVVRSTTGPRDPRDNGGFRVSVSRTVSDAGAVVVQDSTSWTYGPPLA